MSKPIAFIQVYGRLDVLEIELSDTTTLGELRDALETAGVKLDAETFIFIDDAEKHLDGERHERLLGFKHGCRIHVCRCRRIKTMVNYLSDTAEHVFAPGARVRAVKEWAVRKFNLSPKDAAEHVLQLCESKDRPSSDTPLHQLVKKTDRPSDCEQDQQREHHCKLCFDLVPDKRVEG